MTRTVALYVGCALYDGMTVVCGVWLKIKDQICSFIPHIGLLPYNFMCERFDLVYCSLSVLRFVFMSIHVHAHVTGSHSSYLWLGFDLTFFNFVFLVLWIWWTVMKTDLPLLVHSELLQPSAWVYCFSGVMKRSSLQSSTSGFRALRFLASLAVSLQ